MNLRSLIVVARRRYWHSACRDAPIPRAGPSLGRYPNQSGRHFRFRYAVQTELRGLPWHGRQRWRSARSRRSGLSRGRRRYGAASSGHEWNFWHFHAGFRAKCRRYAHRQTNRHSRERHSRALGEAGSAAGRESSDLRCSGSGRSLRAARMFMPRIAPPATAREVAVERKQVPS